MKHFLRVRVVKFKQVGKAQNKRNHQIIKNSRVFRTQKIFQNLFKAQNLKTKRKELLVEKEIESKE